VAGFTAARSTDGECTRGQLWYGHASLLKAPIIYRESLKTANHARPCTDQMPTGCALGYNLKLKHYPVFLDLKDRPVLVVGAGKVALRKTRGLLEAGARITVVAPDCEPEFEELPVRLVRRRFRASDLAGALLVYAATDDRLTK